MNKLCKNFIFDIILAALSLGLFVISLPPIDIGEGIVRLLIATLLVAYLALYLYDRIRHSRGTMFVLAVVEFSLVCLLVLLLIFGQLDIVDSEASAFLGIAIWLRGAVCLIGMYITASSAKKNRYKLSEFIGYLFLTTLGVYLYANPFISDYAITWIICILFFLFAAAFAALAVLYSPAREKRRDNVKKDGITTGRNN